MKSAIVVHIKHPPEILTANEVKVIHTKEYDRLGGLDLVIKETLDRGRKAMINLARVTVTDLLLHCLVLQEE